jgi:uncharacterized protein YjdB
MEKDNLCSNPGTTNRMTDRNSHKNQTNHKNHSSDSSRIKQISFLLFILCFFATHNITAQTSGQTGTCKWTLSGTSPNYTLTISPNGTGVMGDYDHSTYPPNSIQPWYPNNISNIKTLIIQHGVTHIGNYAFYDCSNLTSVTIPNSVTTIGNNAFEKCRGFTSITIPNSVTSIGNGAFGGCIGLTGITIPNSITSIGNYVFNTCSGLTSVTIPNSVTSIGNYAFGGCSGLTSITIPNLVTSIGSYAFRDCSGLTSITIPNLITTIGDGTFYNCSSLTNVTIPNSVTSIGDDAFRGCSSLTSITIPNLVTSIGSYAFRDCSGLTSITIPNLITAIGDGTFYNCSSLNVTIPNSVASIGGYAFYNCSSLTNVTIPNSVPSIGTYAFSGCSSLTNVTIPNSVTTIGANAFRNCTGLTGVTIGNSVTTIGTSAFSGCSSLTNVTIGNSVTTIGAQSFRDCSGLTSITIPNSVTSIGDYAFLNCTGITDIYVKAVNPPTIFSTTFSGRRDIIVHVPCGSGTAYKAANYWKYLTNIIEANNFLQVYNTTTGSIHVIQANTCTNNTATIQAIPNPCYYFVQWSDGDTQNPRDIIVTSDITLTATFAPTVVSVTVTNQGPVCAGSDRTLTYSSNPAGTVEWTSDNTSVATVNGTTGTVHGVSAGTATITCKVTTAAGCTGSATYTITVNALPSAPVTGSPVDVCYDGYLHTGSATAGTNETVVWYTEATGGTTTTAPGLTDAGTLTAYAAAKNTATGCESATRTAVTVTVKPLATASDITASGTEICSGKTASLTAVSSTVSNPTFKWYASQTGSGELHTGTTYTPSPTVTTTYYVSVSGTGYCENAENTRKAVTVTVNPLATASDITASGTVICSGATANLTAVSSTVSNPTFKWYASQTGSGELHTGTTYTPSPTVTTTYYVSVSGTGYCENAENDRKAVTVTVNPLPTAPSPNSVEVCYDGATHTGSATVGTNETVVWYTEATGGTVTVAPSLTDAGTLTRYAAAKVTATDCESATRTAVTVTVKEKPLTGTVSGNETLCVGSTVTLTSTVSNGVWKSEDESKATVDTDGKVTGVSEGEVNIWYIVSNGHGCSDSVSHKITVNPKPLTGTVNGASAVCVGSTATLTPTVSNGVWKSENDSKATVNGGAVTGVSAGEVYMVYRDQRTWLQRQRI